jgi:hypothetical protein
VRVWYRDVSSWSRNMIHSSINNDGWQRFRLTLKGLSTEDKLDNLEGYCQRREKDGNRMSAVEKCRVDNYINALLRGGQLVRGWDNMIRVQR